MYDIATIVDVSHKEPNSLAAITVTDFTTTLLHNQLQDTLISGTSTFKPAGTLEVGANQPAGI